ncbi:hypothetical protein CEXT_272131 [Caerostris extrusa]|uniref:Uncharacterized protein n=1 Tax=Caerostris extrusa TaxID=172846 RepID=A0AAV4PRB9_CAEEX|nr:hypothetical protein CEXT_272131 [Caerostris extrusa]
MVHHDDDTFSKPNPATFKDGLKTNKNHKKWNWKKREVSKHDFLQIGNAIRPELAKRSTCSEDCLDLLLMRRVALQTYVMNVRGGIEAKLSNQCFLSISYEKLDSDMVILYVKELDNVC